MIFGHMFEWMYNFPGIILEMQVHGNITGTNIGTEEGKSTGPTPLKH